MVLYINNEVVVSNGDSCWADIIDDVAYITPNDFKLYPNPTHDIIYIDGFNHDNWRIVDNTGKNSLQGETTNQIDLSGLHNGVYYLQLFSKEGLISKILIKVE